MPNWFTRRLDFWKRAFYNKVRAAMGALITAFTIALIIRDGVVNPDKRDWVLLKFIPNLPWYWWAIIGLLALLLLVLEGAYAENKIELADYRNRYKTRLTEIKKDHRAELTAAQLRSLIGANGPKEERAIDLLPDFPDPVKAISAPTIAPEEIKADQGMACIKTFVGHFEFQDGETPIQKKTETGETFIGAIAEFVKSPDATGWVGGVDFLEAQITFLNTDDSFVHRISDCLWIGQRESYIRDLSPGARARLLVAMSLSRKAIAAERVHGDTDTEFFLLVDEKYHVIINLNINDRPLKFELATTPQLALRQM